MKLARKILGRRPPKSDSVKRVYRSAAPEVERASSGAVKAAVDSPLDFNEVEFLEYDPTPYDGGYDIALTYGKPLLASDAICYPRAAWDANSKNLEEFSYGSVVAPYGQELVRVDDKERIQNGGGFKDLSAEEMPKYDGNTDLPGGTSPNHGSNTWGGHTFSYGNGYGSGENGNHGSNTWGGDTFSYGNGYGSGENGIGDEGPVDTYRGGEERVGYDYGMEETQQYGYGFDSNWVHPYNDLFGGWLWSGSREGESYRPYDGDNTGNGNQWKGTADYLFGFSYPYDENRDDGHPTYWYERHSKTQPHHVFVESGGSPWTAEPSYCQAYEDDALRLTEFVPPCERHSYEQHQYDQSEYSESLWFKELGQ